MPDTIMSRDFAANPSHQPLLKGAQMRDLWAAYEAARDSYREKEFGSFADAADADSASARAHLETYFSNRLWREKADEPLPVAAE